MTKIGDVFDSFGNHIGDLEVDDSNGLAGCLAPIILILGACWALAQLPNWLVWIILIVVAVMVVRWIGIRTTAWIVGIIAVWVLINVASSHNNPASPSAAPTTAPARNILASNVSSPAVSAPAPAPTSAPASGLRYFIPTDLPPVITVANTDGMGVYIRRTPDMADRIRAWPEGTRLITLGRMADDPDGVGWVEVQDPAGNRGWVPYQYTVPSR